MKGVTRSYMARRVRCAIVESLRKKGFNSDGTSADGTGKEIYGSAQFRTETPALTLPFVEIVKQTDIAIERLIKGIQMKDDKSARTKKGLTNGQGGLKGGSRNNKFDQSSKGQSVASISNLAQRAKKVRKPREERWGRPVDEL